MREHLSSRRGVKKREATARTAPRISIQNAVESVSCPTSLEEEDMNRSSILCVTLLLAGAVSAAHADVEYNMSDKKAPAAHPAAAPAPAPAPAPGPSISDKGGMAPPVVPGKPAAPAPAAAPGATTATWWGHAA